MRLNKMIRSVFDVLQRNAIVVLFFILVLCSFFWHIVARSEHFQECDSSIVYAALHNFPSMAISYNAALYNSESDIKESEHFKNRAQYTVKDFIYKIKSFLIEEISAMDPPYSIRSAFALPLSTTYSFGHGLVYGLLTTENTSYKDFMARNLVVTVLLFHISVLLLFATLFVLGIDKRAVFATSLTMLFSISLYSYGYHLGSTIWNVFTASLMLWFTAVYWDRKRFLMGISALTSVLIFFNYLIVFYWVGVSWAYYKVHYINSNSKISWRRIVDFAETQYLSITFISICAVLFFQPGQGYRGNPTSVKELSIYFYYIVLNFFSVYNKNFLIDVAQFLTALIILIFGIRFLFSDSRKIIIFFKNIVGALFVLFWIAFIFRILSFVPSRHILAFTPPIFILLGFGMYQLSFRVIFKQLWVVGIILFIIAGSFSLKQRRADVYDNTLKMPARIHGGSVVTNDGAFSLLYRQWDTNIPAVLLNPNMLLKEQLQVGKPYLYISQTISPIDFNNSLWREKINVDIKEQKSIITSVRFTAYDPKPFVYNRPNNLFIEDFEISSID